MPSPKSLLILCLLLLMDLLAGFAVIVGSGLLDATSLRYTFFWPFVLAGAVGLAAGLGANAAQIKPPWDRAVLIAVILIFGITLASVVSRSTLPLLVALLLFAIAGWRGTSIANESAVHSEVQRRFSIGVGAYFFGLIWTVARGIIFERPIWQMLALIGIAFIVVAMVALVAARVSPSSVPGAAPAVVLAVGLQIALIAGVGAVSLVLLGHDIGAVLFNLTRPFWDVAGAIWNGMLSPVLMAVTWLIDILRPHAGHVRHFTPPVNQLNPHGNGRNLHAGKNNSTWLVALGLVLFGAALAGVCALIWYAAPRVRERATRPGYREERESTGSLTLIVRALLEWLRRLFSKSAVLATDAVVTTRRRVFGPEYPSDPVRHVYAQVLYRAGRIGVVRAPNVTPMEFQAVLQTLWPAGVEDFAAVTHAYVVRRYGDATVPAEEVEALRQRWHRLRQLMRRSTDVEVQITSREPSDLERPRDWKDRLRAAFPEDSLKALAVDIGAPVISFAVIMALITLLIVIAIVLGGK